MNFQPRGISEQGLQGPSSYQSEIEQAEALLKAVPPLPAWSIRALFANLATENRGRGQADPCGCPVAASSIVQVVS